MAVAQPHQRIPAWTLGDRLRKSRETAGLSTEQMATLMEKSESTINAWENDTRNPAKAFDTLLKWATVTDVNYNWLLTGSDKLVTYDERLVIVDEDHPRIPGLDLPPTRPERNASLSLV